MAINVTDIIEMVEAIKELGLPGETSVYDMGCGTGLIGRKLQDLGFTDILGTDASEKFVQASHEKGCYREVKLMFNGQGVDLFPTELKNRFGLVSASGVWLKGHIPAVGLEDVHASLLPGGYFVTSMRIFYYVPGQE